jgi:hypothetical protein
MKIEEEEEKREKKRYAMVLPPMVRVLLQPNDARRLFLMAVAHLANEELSFEQRYILLDLVLDLVRQLLRGLQDIEEDLRHLQ